MAKKTTAADLRGKEIAELEEFVRTTQANLLKSRFQNFTNKLTDTASLRAQRRDVARALTILGVKRRATKTEAKADAKPAAKEG